MYSGDLMPINKWAKECYINDELRPDMLKSNIINQRILDFGCGAGRFLQLAQPLAAKVLGVELELRVCKNWKSKMNVVNDLENVSGDFGLITAFYVLENFNNPRETLKTLSKYSNRSGNIVIEVPSVNDVL